MCLVGTPTYCQQTEINTCCVHPKKDFVQGKILLTTLGRNQHHQDPKSPPSWDPLWPRGLLHSPGPARGSRGTGSYLSALYIILGASKSSKCQSHFRGPLPPSPALGKRAAAPKWSSYFIITKSAPVTYTYPQL